MRFPVISAVLAVALLVTASVPSMAQDPGVPDTVRIDDATLVVGQSKPLRMTIVNDELVTGYSLGFILNTADSGYATYDSAVYVNRMEDPTVLTYRIENYYPSSVPDQDTLFLGGLRIGTGQGLPPGNDVIVDLYFTGTSAGMMTVDSGYIPPAGIFKLVAEAGASEKDAAQVNVYPEWSPGQIQIVTGTFPPTLEAPDWIEPDIAGSQISFPVEGASPEGFPITLSLVDLTGYDDDSMTPTNASTLTAGNPAQFSWSTTSADVGIWKATFSVCDSSGNCVSAETVIQIAESSDYLLSFSQTENENTADVVALVHGNFDSDAYLELFTSGASTRYSPVFELYDFEPPDSWVKAYDSTSGFPQFGPCAGFFNDDQYLDVAVMGYRNTNEYRLSVMLGDGGNSFTVSEQSCDGHVTRNAVLGEFTGDNYIDYACNWWDGIHIYAGSSSGVFSYYTTVATADSALVLNSADLNSDGYDDLAVGTSSGMEIHLGDGSGGFSLAGYYAQTYGSSDIKITNQGSDFNNDDIYDLCISTPSVGGQQSQMILYLGNGDGTFTQNPVRTVYGQIFGNCVGDFNGDGELDIAYVNGSKRTACILFGDGNGEFTNEIRYKIPHNLPQRIDCFDADRDGDLDILVAANGGQSGYSIFTLFNQLNPTGYSGRSVEIDAYDDAEIELVSSSGRVFNRMKNSMPSGDYYRRNSNGNGTIDALAAIGVVESDEYILSATPRADLPVGGLFSLEFTLNGAPYRLTRDVPMTETGYKFGLFLGMSSGVLPRPGKFSQANPPTFMWEGSGTFDLELASSIDFSEPLVNTIISGNTYTPVDALSVEDTTTYYWRVKPHGSADFDCIYVVNMVTGSGTGSGDVDQSGAIDVDDAVFLIAYIFLGGASPAPEVCVGDVDASGAVDIDDVVFLLAYIFMGGPAPLDGC